MATVTFSNGQSATFNGTPTPQDVDFVAQKMGIQPGDRSTGTATPQTPDQQSAERYHPLFPSSANDNALEAGLKSVGNVIPSAVNFGRGVLDFLNPVHIAQNIASIPGQFGELSRETAAAKNAQQNNYSSNAPQTAPASALGGFLKAVPGAAYNTVVPESAQGGIKALGGAITGNQQNIDTGLGMMQRSLTNDPVGQIFPWLALGEAGAKGLDRMATDRANVGYEPGGGLQGPPQPPITSMQDIFNKGIETVARPVTMAGEKIGGTIGDIARYGAAKATGLEPTDISNIMKNPADYSKAAIDNTNRNNISQEIAQALEEKKNEVSDIGKGYNDIRAQTKPIKTTPNYVAQLIKQETGNDVIDGKVTTSGSASIRDARDIRALQNLYDVWQPEFAKGKLTANEALNFRDSLGKLSRFEREITQSTDLENAAKGMRANFNEVYRPKIQGLAERDAIFSPKIKEYNDLKDGILDNSNQLKDSVINKIATAYKSGREPFLKQLEDIKPGITNKIQQLHTIENISKASRGGLVNILGELGLGHLSGHLLGTLVFMFLTAPERAVSLLRGAGATQQGITKIGSYIKNNIPSTDKLTIPILLKPK